MYRIYENNDKLKILLPDSVYGEICKSIAHFFPNECGGIFVGKIDTNKGEAVVDLMRMPNRFNSSPVLFQRFAGFLNRWLRKIFKESNGDRIYLGEWHSHPNGVPYPSQTDYLTMQKIAVNDNVRIQTPILMIVGYNGLTFKEQFFIYSQQDLIHYVKQN